MIPRQVVWGVGAAAVALGATLAVTLFATLDSREEAAAATVALLLVGGSFVVAGLHAWRRRPGNRVGPLMIATGFSWLVAGFVEAREPLPFSIGYVAGALPFAFVVHLLLAYPTGRLRSRLARVVVVAAYVVTTVGSLSVSLFVREVDGLDDQPRNLLLVADEPGLADALETAATLTGVALVLLATGLLARRWLAATPVERRGLAPLLGTGALFLAALAVTLTADQLSGDSLALGILGAIAMLLFLAVPYAYLIGLLGSRASRATAVGELVQRLSEAGSRGSLRDAIAAALGDPELDLVFRRPDRDEWVDAGGRRVSLARAGLGRAITPIARDGETIGAIVHHRGLTEERELLANTAAAAALALDNDRLAAALRARVAELQESRANIVSCGLSERRRLERDLHDGAQQRLVALSLQVNLAADKLHDDPATAATLLDRARDELRHALEELRELARGIHPAILTDHGLDAAVGALAGRSPVPVQVRPLPSERLPSPVEAVAYFVVAESLTNVAKYARARQAEVRVERADGRAIVEVRDDGVGGASVERGTGLRGLADRVEALDGHLNIRSEPGEGTIVRAEIPCASS